MTADSSIDRLILPRSAIGVLAAAALCASALFAGGQRDYPNLHTTLDAAMFLLSGVLTMLLWDMGARVDHPFPKWLAASFAMTATLELAHVIVTVEWFGRLEPVAQAMNSLRPATWPPAAYVLPAGVGGAIWLLRKRVKRTLPFALLLAAFGVGLLLYFYSAPRYLPPGWFGVTRPTLVAVPLLWAIIGVLAWRWSPMDRLLPMLALMALVLAIGNGPMMFSRAPHDTQAMVAHLAKVTAYMVLLLSVMRIAAIDMSARVQAEKALAVLNEELEHRVVDRTVQLDTTNKALEAEISVRQHAEAKIGAQLERLNLLHQITRAIGERQDLNSIFQVVVRSLEDQLPVDFVCLCLYDATDRTLTVVRIGTKSTVIASALAMPEQARIEIDDNGLTRCVHGQLVYEADIGESGFPFPQRLAQGGLRSLVIAPLQVESQVFGVLVVARIQPNSFSSGECEFVRQLSEHVALAANQAQLHAVLQQAYDDLRKTQQAIMQQERLRALGQMASGIAHDINNAISPVTLYVDSLLETETGLTSRGRGYLAVVQRAIDDVAHTVARMGAFYRQREPAILLARVQLNTLVLQALDLTRARWSDMPQLRGIAIETRTELENDLPAIMGVEGEIRDALTNLIFNAVDALPHGGVLTLRTASAPARNAPKGARHVTVEIADSGIGMDEETRRRCLEPFFTTKGERGTGLGLAMVYGVAQRHGAELEIESTPGRGTVVRLDFEGVAAIDGEPAQMGTSTLPRRMRILIIDDDPLLLNSLREILQNDGHLVIDANGGQAGIDTFRASTLEGNPFAAVITDLGMPHVDGRKVATAIKGLSPETPVLLLTGWGQRLVAEQDMPPHVDRVLNKPPRLHDLREALRAVGGPGQS